MAANLRAAGHQVYVWSRSPHSSPNFLGSVVEVADLCEVMQIFVGNDEALLEVIRTIAAALAPHHIVCGHATVSPAAAREAATIVEGQGARYLDVPFTGSKTAAQNRQLVYYIGGDEQTLAEMQGVLEVTSKKIVHVGGVGDASTVKIATNMLTAATVQTLAEMLALVRAAGVDGQKLVEAMENNASQSGTSALKLPAMIAQDFEANFSLKHMCKDLRLALDLAEDLSLSVPTTATTADVFAESLDEGWGDEDFSVVARNYPLPPPPEPAPGQDDEESESGESATEGPTHNAAGASPTEKAAPGSRPAHADSVAAGARRAPPAHQTPAPVSSASKKSTLRIIREFFKPQPLERP